MNPKGKAVLDSAGEIDAFLAKVSATPPSATTTRRGRLLFSMDATASREPSWDRACNIQAEMFDATSQLGGLDVQLAYYRGINEFYVSPWVKDAHTLGRLMSSVRCRGGITQIGRLLAHGLSEAKRKKVDALVFVGDCMEESVDHLCAAAGELSMLGVPVFIFQEGTDTIAERAFREICRLTQGAHCRFDVTSAEQLRQLLAAVAVFATGGRAALAQLKHTELPALQQIVKQLG